MDELRDALELVVVDLLGYVEDGVIVGVQTGMKEERVYADSCGLKTAFLGNGGRNAATIFSLRYSSSR